MGADSAWFFCFYSVIWTFTLLRLLRAPWFFDSSAYWVNHGMTVAPFPYVFTHPIFHTRFRSFFITS